MTRETDFLYATGRVRVLETKLLSRSDIERILNADGPEEAFKILSDTDYGNDLSDVASVYDFETVLEESIKRTFGVVRQSVEEPRIIRFFTLKYDYHNLKVVVKNQILGIKSKEYFSYLGNVNPEEMQKLAEEDKSADVPENIRNAYNEAIELYESTKDPQQVDIVIDKALYDDMRELATAMNDDFLKNYLVTSIDLINIKILVRLMKIKAEGKTLAEALLPGGKLGIDFIESLFAGSLQEVVEALERTPYQPVVAAGLSKWISSGSPEAFEKAVDNYLLELAKVGRMKPFGSEPIIGYLLARENEIKVLRIILVGKINGISSDMIRERLRELYV
jgi:V/A-type H+-transporting ATPase subunit C